MLQALRSNTKNFAIYLIFGILIAVFIVMFGPQSNDLSCGARESYAVKVDGDDITEKQWRFTVMGLTGGQGTFPQARLMKFRETVLDGLIARELLSEAAEDAGFRVSKEEVEKRIAEGELFFLGQPMGGERYYFPDGHFDYDALDRYAKFLGVSIENFIEFQRQEMLAQKMRDLLAESTRVSPEEAQTEYENNETVTDFEVVEFDPRRYAGATTLTPADIAAYATSHEKELKDKYELDKTLYTGRPKEVRVRHILLESKAKLERVSGADAPDAPAVAIDVKADPAHTKAEAILARLKKGEDFAKIAREASDEKSTGEKGGDLGWRPETAMGLYGPEFQTAVAKLAPGQLSDVIESETGYHVAMLQDVREGDLAFDRVKLDLAETMLREDKGKELAKAEATAALGRAKEGWPLEEQYEKAPVSRQIQGLPPGIEIPGLNAPEEGALDPRLLGIDHDTALAQTGGTADPAPAPAAADAPKPAAAKPAAAKPTATAAAKPAEAEKAPRRAPSALPDDLRPRVKPYEGIRRDGTAGENGFPVAAVESSKELRRLLFEALEPGQLAPEVVEVDGKYLVVKLGARTEADMKAFETEKTAIVQRLAQARAGEVVKNWVATRCEALLADGQIDWVAEYASYPDTDAKTGQVIPTVYRPCMTMH